MAEEKWLSAAEQESWLALVGTILRLPTQLDAQLTKRANLTFFSYLVLAMLSESPDRTLTMTELANQTSSSASRLSHVVSKLEKRGWIRRSPSPDDRRVTLATLTDAGWEGIVDTAPSHVAHVQQLIYSQLTAQDVADLSRVLTKITTKVESCPAPTI